MSKKVVIPEKTVMSPRASIAPANTVTLGFRIDKIAAIKNVLSPSSDTIITDIDARKA